MGAGASSEKPIGGEPIRYDYRDVTTPAAQEKRRIGRPCAAHGKFLRFITVNDVYKLDNYPRVASAVKEFKGFAADDDAVVLSCLPGDFLAPCTLTNLDGGVAMLRALNEVPIDYVMFGNHEFDLKTPQLQTRIKEYKGKWLNSNVTAPQFVDHNDKPLAEYEIIDVGERKVATAAFLLDDMNQFAPRSDLKIAPPAESILKTWEAIKSCGSKVDAFLPMLHLNIKEDRALADFIAKHDDMAKLTPLLLAAHDHEVYIEQAGKSLIFKTGCDADNIGIVDLFWTADGKLKRQVHMLEAEDFPSEPRVKEFVDKELAMMAAIMEVTILDLPDLGKMSTNRVRFEPEVMVSFLLSQVRKSMPNVDMVFLQGGNVRGMTPEYKAGPFTYGDLMKEFAFDTHQAIVQLPGEVIEASIRSTRTPEGAKPFFLHADMEVKFGDGWSITEVNGQPFDSKKMYTVGTYQFLLNGMGNIEPLTTYCKENGTCPPLDTCRGIKDYFMKTCIRASWLNLVGGPADGYQAGNGTALSSAFDTIDTKKDGVLDEEEVSAYVQSSGKADAKLVKFLISAFDEAGNGVLSRSEFEAIAG